jgi:hypothetical protein
MYLVRSLLPLYDNAGQPFGPEAFDRVRNELTAQFGGVTAYRHAPAEGLWRTDDGGLSRDEMVMFEVMTAQLERGWWTSYKRELAARFRQEELLVRATEFEPL